MRQGYRGVTGLKTGYTERAGPLDRRDGAARRRRAGRRAAALLRPGDAGPQAARPRASRRCARKRPSPAASAEHRLTCPAVAVPVRQRGDLLAERLHHGGVELRPGAGAELRERLLDRSSRRGRGGCVVIASNASHTATMRAPSGIASPASAVRVAGAVPVLVARAHELRDRQQRGRGAQDALADDRVLAHEGPLLVGQRAGLVQDLVRDRHLADVVQLGRAHDLVQLLGEQRQPRADAHRELRDALQVVRRGRARARAGPAAGCRASGGWPRSGGPPCARTCAGRRSAAPGSRRAPRAAGSRRRARP